MGSDSERVTKENGHVYPSLYVPPTGNAEIDEAWRMLDMTAPGVIPADTRFFLAGMIARALMRYKERR